MWKHYVCSVAAIRQKFHFQQQQQQRRRQSLCVLTAAVMLMDRRAALCLSAELTLSPTMALCDRRAAASRDAAVWGGAEWKQAWSDYPNKSVVERHSFSSRRPQAFSSGRPQWQNCERLFISRLPAPDREQGGSASPLKVAGTLNSQHRAWKWDSLIIIIVSLSGCEDTGNVPEQQILIFQPRWKSF